jgi:hypothetical protein
MVKRKTPNFCQELNPDHAVHSLVAILNELNKKDTKIKENLGLIPCGGRDFPLCHCVQTSCGGPSTLLSNGHWGLFPWR